jgi:hypothetical protein
MQEKCPLVGIDILSFFSAGCIENVIGLASRNRNTECAIFTPLTRSVALPTLVLNQAGSLG